MFESIVLGLFSTLVLLFASASAVIGVKSVWLFVFNRLEIKKPKKQNNPRKKLNTVYIDPEQVDRICVKRQ